jgi:DNA repair protein RecO (recombination protein O)
MQWTDNAIVLGTRHFGEAGVILEVMARQRGRQLGLVRGGVSRRLRGVLQPGNGVRATWRARLDEHLGAFSVEPVNERAGRIIESATALYGVTLLAAHLRLLPERDPHPALYDAAEIILSSLHDPAVAPALMVRFELALLEELGFGLDLKACAVTGSTEDLAYVSPRSGRAVSRSASTPYADRLLVLPGFLTGQRSGMLRVAEIEAGFLLTGHFLERDVYDARGLPVPDARESFLAAARRASR